MNRLPNWATRLDKYLRVTAAVPFSYDAKQGLDCCTFTFGAIHAMTGRNIGQPFAGKYVNLRQALRTMRAYCGSPSLFLFAHELLQSEHFSPQSPTMAQRGDVLFSTQLTGFTPFLGILDLGGRDILGVGDRGVRRVPLADATFSWRI